MNVIDHAAGDLGRALAVIVDRSFQTVHGRILLFEFLRRELRGVLHGDDPRRAAAIKVRFRAYTLEDESVRGVLDRLTLVCYELPHRLESLLKLVAVYSRPQNIIPTFRQSNIALHLF